jgi:hypothetical protein
MVELPLETQLRHRAFCDDVNKMSPTQMIQMLTFIHDQMLRQDYHYRQILAQHWGLTPNRLNEIVPGDDGGIEPS